MASIDENLDKAGDQTSAFSGPDPFARKDKPDFSLTIWPNRSMPQHGFHKILWFTGGMLCLPLIPLLGTPVGWALIPFLLGTLFLLWFFIKWNYRDGGLREVLNIWPDLITIERFEPNGKISRWHANPFWASTELYADGKIENYLTLKGNGREVELGAFLSPEERVSLRDDVERALGNARMSGRVDPT